MDAAGRCSRARAASGEGCPQQKKAALQCNATLAMYCTYPLRGNTITAVRRCVVASCRHLRFLCLGGDRPVSGVSLYVPKAVLAERANRRGLSGNESSESAWVTKVRYLATPEEEQVLGMYPV